MKHVYSLILLILIVHVSSAYGQLSIENCQEKAQKNYPLVRQYKLIEQTESYNLSNAQKGYLPQVSLNAKATYQSEVITLPIKLPGVTIESLSKDQYQANIEVNQVLWDGGAIRSQKEILQSQTLVEKQKLEVDLYSLKERVNQLFFGILLLNEQINLNDILQKELANNYNRVFAAMQNGVANQSDVDAIRVEQLKAKQKKVELASTVTAYKQMLSAFIGEQITAETILEKPNSQFSLAQPDLLNRPELKLFEVQNSLYESQKKSLYAANMPKVGLFVQGGYGKPGLNMLNNKFSPYYIGGIRLNWNFGNLYMQNNNIAKIDLNKQGVDVQKQTFLFNTNMKTTQQNAEYEKIIQLIETDDEIIKLRTSIKKSAETKVENGTYTVTDLIREINAENMAIQEKSFHEIQLLIAIYTIKNTMNN